MTINQHNYDTYLMLYADGELDPLGKQLVEAYVQNNGHAAAELQLLQNARFGAATDAEPMPHKHRLYKALPWQFEALLPTQQQLLLHLDGELDPQSSADLDQLLAHDAEVYAEWQTLQPAKLDSQEVLEMPNKRRLLRQVEKTPLVRFAHWKRLAVAAAILGMGAFLMTNLSKVDGPAVGAPVANQVTATNTPTPGVPVSPKQQHRVDAGATPTTEDKQTRKATRGTTQEAPAPIVPSPGAALAVALQPTPTPTLPAYPEPEATVAVVEVPANANPSAEQPGATQATATEPAIASGVSYADAPLDQDTYVYIGGAKIKKQKLRGVFRKVGRTVGRTLESNTIARAFVEVPDMR
jgi:anti-sigma factor RsiW